MSGSFTSVNLADLPSPDVVEQISFEDILAAMLADLRQRAPEFTALVESDPAYKILEVAAYRETLIRKRVNEAARAVMLAYAMKADLDQIAANFNVQRLVIDEGDLNAVPPIPPTYESDTDLRRRVQLAFEGLSTAGPRGAYIFHALSADADVADVSAVSDTPGNVDVYVLSRGQSGSPSPAVLAAVEAALSADDVRPLTDNVAVLPVETINYTVEAEIEVFSGPDPSVVVAAADAAVQKYVADQRRIGLPVTRSGLFAALHQPGARNVILTQPSADIDATDRQACVCTGVFVRAR